MQSLYKFMYQISKSFILMLTRFNDLSKFAKIPKIK